MTPPPGSPAAWILAARPKTLTAGAVPVAVGTACAYALGGLRAGPALAALAGALMIQIGTNFANDVFDFERGADDDARLGPTRAAQAGLLTPRELRGGMIAAFALAMTAGIYLVTVGGWPIVAIGIASILSGIAYTGGPYPLGYHGLGDVFVMVFFGFVAVCGTAYVQMGAVPALAVWASIPVGALATAVLAVNNARDRETDARTGKRTLAVRLGARGALFEYAALIAIAFATPLALVFTGAASAWALLPLASLPAGVALARRLFRSPPAAMNPVLERTAQLLMVFGILFAVGLAL
jgi:1,4-dihydroxy-2-naphthoate octaprenyltransferase